MMALFIVDAVLVSDNFWFAPRMIIDMTYNISLILILILAQSSKERKTISYQVTIFLSIAVLLFGMTFIFVRDASGLFLKTEIIHIIIKSTLIFELISSLGYEVRFNCTDKRDSRGYSHISQLSE